MQIKILLVEDQKLMRIGIKSLFCDYPELEIIGEAVNGKEAVEKAFPYDSGWWVQFCRYYAEEVS